MNLAFLLERAALLWPDRVAVVDGQREQTFGELDRRASQLGDAVSSLGLGQGDRVAVLVGNQYEWFEITLGLMKAGVVRTYLNPRFAPAEVSYQLDHAGASVLITSAEFLPLVESADLEQVKHVIVVEEDYEALLDNGSSEFRAVNVPDDHPIEFRYTSGTTGSPKGAVLTHGQYRAHAHGMMYHCNWGEGDVILHVGPLSHSSGGMVVGMLAAGGKNIIQHGFDVTEMLENIERHRVTTMIMVPTMIYMLLDKVQELATDVSSIRNILYASAPMSPERMERCIEIFGPVFAGVFGMTESLGPTTFLPKTEHVPGSRTLASVGRPTSFGEVKIADAEGNEVPRGTVGELFTRGPLLFKEYWGNAEATASSFTEDGWFRTGDMCSMDENGYVHIVDRKKDMIISGGFNVYPAEVEHALLAHDAVAEVVVVGLDDPTWGEAVTAVVHLHDGATASEAELNQWCRKRIAGYKVPKSIRFSADNLPKNPNGKLLRRTVREQLNTDRRTSSPA